MDTFGTFFKVTLFGESHGQAVGAVIDGVPPGLPIEAGDFARAILRRKTGTGKTGVSARQEDDIPEILGGVYNGCTTGAPLAVMFRNRDQRPEDYEAFEQIPRPGHADFTASVKYNYFNDPRGGGHFSGRLTAPLCIAGGIAIEQLESLGISVISRIYSVGDVYDEGELLSSTLSRTVSLRATLSGALWSAGLLESRQASGSRSSTRWSPLFHM